MNDVLDGPDCAAVEQEITEALDALGADSDAVLTTLDALAYLPRHVHTDATQAVCEYLQRRLDATGTEVVIEGCDTVSVDYRVINPDGETFTHDSVQVPWPVLIFFCRAEDGDYDFVVVA